MPANAIAVELVVAAVSELAPPPVAIEPTLTYRDDIRPSAVLILLADGAHGAEVLLTRRSLNLRSHGGEVSFPGGRLDPGEDARTAALRETHEEVGIAPELVTVVGELYPIGTYVSRSWITPIVGHTAEPVAVEPRSVEVDRAFWVPLHDLTRPGTFREEWWPTAVGERPIFFFELDDELVWGATARILHQLLRVAHRIEGDEPPAL